MALRRQDRSSASGHNWASLDFPDTFLRWMMSREVFHGEGGRLFAKKILEDSRMPKIDISRVPARKGTGYPPQFNTPCAERVRQRLGDAGGLKDFGVNLMRLPPGNWSSQRHWHSQEDEFVYVLDGEL
ncbi:MAG: cupin domain-containing protein, partial [Acetobacteraceae bacterium]|nr:cupin domain-containing protein [Acetobacteraceae bacterium]